MEYLYVRSFRVSRFLKLFSFIYVDQSVIYTYVALVLTFDSWVWCFVVEINFSLIALALILASDLCSFPVIKSKFILI